MRPTPPGVLSVARLGATPAMRTDDRRIRVVPDLCRAPPTLVHLVELAGGAAGLEQRLNFTPLSVRVGDGPAAVLAVGIGERGFR
jgi:hypothetical protein